MTASIEEWKHSPCKSVCEMCVCYSSLLLILFTLGSAWGLHLSPPAWSVCSTSLQVTQAHPCFFISVSTVLLQVSLGLPLFLQRLESTCGLPLAVMLVAYAAHVQSISIGVCYVCYLGCVLSSGSENDTFPLSHFSCTLILWSSCFSVRKVEGCGVTHALYLLSVQKTNHCPLMASLMESHFPFLDVHDVEILFPIIEILFQTLWLSDWAAVT